MVLTVHRRCRHNTVDETSSFVRKGPTLSADEALYSVDGERNPEHLGEGDREVAGKVVLEGFVELPMEDERYGEQENRQEP